MSDKSSTQPQTGKRKRVQSSGDIPSQAYRSSSVASTESLKSENITVGLQASPGSTTPSEVREQEDSSDAKAKPEAYKAETGSTYVVEIAKKPYLLADNTSLLPLDPSAEELSLHSSPANLLHQGESWAKVILDQRQSVAL